MSDNQKVVRAAKWSVFSEILAKVISPITTIVLARLLSKEIFGIVASLTAITSMADLLSDAGFNAYIVQHIFKSDKERKSTYNICFWTNVSIAIILFLVIVLNKDLFARLVGAEGYGNVLIVASIVIPMVSVSSIEMAIMKKELNFKSLGIIKIISKLIPFFVTIPLALYGFGYWSLVYGSLAGEFIGMILCLYHGRFFPSFSYPTQYLRQIFSFSIWAYFESILEWLIGNVSILVLATLYGMIELGIFKVAINLVTQIMTSVYALYSNVFKSAIAKEQNDKVSFKKMFLTFQKYASIISLPLGVGVFLYRDFVTGIMLGKEWLDASILIGLYSLTYTASISFGNFYSDAIRAKGYPKKLVEVDAIYLALIIGLLCFAHNISFATFCIIFSLLKIIQPTLQAIIGQRICDISIKSIFKNCYPQLTAVGTMILVFFTLRAPFFGLQNPIISAIICAFSYFVILYFASPDKEVFNNILSRIRVIKI